MNTHRHRSSFRHQATTKIRESRQTRTSSLHANCAEGYSGFYKSDLATNFELSRVSFQRASYWEPGLWGPPLVGRWTRTYLSSNPSFPIAPSSSPAFIHSNPSQSIPLKHYCGPSYTDDNGNSQLGMHWHTTRLGRKVSDVTSRTRD